LKNDIYFENLDSAYKFLKSDEKGLSTNEARRRLITFGPNAIVQNHKTGLAKRFILSFASPLVLALIVIAIFSLFFGEEISAYLILLMALMGVSLSFIQETRAQNNVEKLLNMVRIKSKVLRNGKLEDIDVTQIVPGDIVSISAGNMAPADLRIIQGKNLYINQSSLTGESMPVEKTADELTRKASDIFSANNVVCMGSSVVGGNALGLVIQTGKNTQFGKLSTELQKRSPETSFDKGIKDFTWLMLRLILVLSIIIFVVNAIFKGNILESMLFALAVAVGLVPEMLPIMVTLNLSKGAINMAKKKVIIKNLHSIQNFGAMDILCTDKTGTLTLDKITLIKYCNFDGEQEKEVLELAYLNSFHQTGVNNILDQAILESHKDTCNTKKIDEIPYDNIRRMLSIIEKTDQKIRMVSKGAPEEIIKKCLNYELNNSIHELTPTAKAKLNEQYKSLSKDGLIVLGVAYRTINEDKENYSIDDEQNLTFKGFVAFLDPPKPTALEAMKRLATMGVGLKILSGDNEFVVRKICSEFELPTDNLITGSQLDKLSDEKLKEMLNKVSVFARLTPLQKERVIKSLQKNGHVVGFLGDGINDAPALKAADVGISVNNAVDIAKDTADIVLLEKDLNVLQDCIADGRRTFRNVVKYIKMGASSNFGNMFSMVGASILLPFLPMLPIQILLNNMLYDFSQITIPTDNVDEDSLVKPTPWNIDFIKKFMFTMGPVSSLFDFITFGLLWYVFRASPEMFHTGWFIESLFTQTLIIWVIRTRKIPFIQSKPSNFLLYSSLAVIMAGSLIVFSSIGKYFGFVSLSPILFISLIIISITYLFTTQIAKNLFIKKFGYE
jgi:Mg2+-importing ATPase